MISMTGYGKGAVRNDKLSAEVEIKSINSRYLDIFFRLPSILQSKEYEIRDIIKNTLKRGKVSIVVSVTVNENKTKKVDKEKLKQYLSQLKEVKKVLKSTEKIKLEHILSNEELFEDDLVSFEEVEFEMVKGALKNALNDLIKMKKKEGKELLKDLQNRINTIEEKVVEIENDVKSNVNEYFEKLKERVKILIEGSDLDDERFKLELALLADKTDITEECVRLRSHLKFFAESMNNDEEPGRKLNFLCQEMHREANTISSKSLSTFIIHNSVYVKEEIEKIREQIQNIE
ncbi:MAG TPA: YicC/YloC family endoribonuclease [Ignavibacteriaceae bacterium]|nr:YicC/YloC family endoribonuclease [Ignavibacteriaceae bacterium]